MRRAGGFQERLVEAPHRIGERSRASALPAVALLAPLTGQGANNISDGLRIHPALLQNLARHSLTWSRMTWSSSVAEPFPADAVGSRMAAPWLAVDEPA